MSMYPVPVTFQASAAPTGIQALTFNEQLQLIARYLTAFIPTEATFIRAGATPPATDVGVFINNNLKNLMWFDNVRGKYLPWAPTNSKIGDKKLSANIGDEINDGWIMEDGRNLSSITGISSVQLLNLQAYYGSDGPLPSGSPLFATTLPDASDFDITLADTVPADGVIEALTFSNPATQVQAEALRDKTAELRNWASDEKTQLQAAIDANKALRDAISSHTTYVKIFIGTP